MKTTRITPACRLLTTGTAALCAFTALTAHVRASPPQYTVTDLGALGANVSYGFGINALGQVTGYSYTGVNNTFDAVILTGATPTDLGTISGYNSYGRGINNSGQVAGYYQGIGGALQIHHHEAVSWSGTTPTQLGTLGGTDTEALGINNFGQVVGYSKTTSGYFHAVVWAGTTPTDLGSSTGNSFGYGINDSGQVAGSAAMGGGFQYAVRWTGAALAVLGGVNSVGNGINASGQVAGWSEVSPGDPNFIHALLWTGQTPTDLGTLGGRKSYGYSVNDSGDVVGISDIDDQGTKVPFLYTGGTMYDLNSLLLPDSGVVGLGVGNGSSSINAAGQIAGWGTIGGQTHALLLSPTPEPASTVLLFGGSALLALRRHRRPAGI